MCTRTERYVEGLDPRFGYTNALKIYRIVGFAIYRYWKL